MRGFAVPTTIALLLAAPLLWRMDSELDMPNQAVGEWQGAAWAGTSTTRREATATSSVSDPQASPVPAQSVEPASPDDTAPMADLTRAEQAGEPARD